MAYSLDTIMAEIVSTIATQTGAAACTHVLSRKGMSLHGVPPRIVWAEGDNDTYGPPRLLGSTTGHGNNPRALWTVHTPVDIHFWAASKEQFEQLRNNEIAAIHRVLHGSYGIGRGVRVPADDAELSLGFAYILSIEIMQPIVDVLVATAKMDGNTTDSLHDVIFEFPSGDVYCGHQALIGHQS